MLEDVNIKNELLKLKAKTRREEEELIQEVGRILNRSAFDKGSVLDNLKNYNKSFELVNEDDVDKDMIFSPAEIKTICIKYRMRFIDSQVYKKEFPYEAVLKIDSINSICKKNLKSFKLLTTFKSLKDKKVEEETLLFATTNVGNYYLVHKWGNQLKWYRKLLYWPLRDIEKLLATLLLVTAAITLSLPTYLITLDRKAGYWDYRYGIFFHLFIFNMGFTTYFTFTFSKGFSVSNWNRSEDLV